MQLSIIIVSYNTRDILLDCLRSVRDSQLQLSYEVIVVDNASTDGSPQMVEREFPDVLLIKNSVNLMFAKANNQAMRIAKGDYFLLLNSDCIVEPGNIEKLYDFIRARQAKVACVGPRVLSQDGSFQSEGNPFDGLGFVLGVLFSPFVLPLPASVKERLLPKGFPRILRGKCRRVGWISGCCMLISRSVITAVGMLDENLFFYHEETDFCLRARQEGFETWVYPDAYITHLGSASMAPNGSIRTDERVAATRLYFLDKFYHRGYWVVVCLLKLFTFVPLMLLSRLLNQRAIVRAFHAQIRLANSDLKLMLGSYA